MVADVMTEIDRRDRPAGDYNRGHGKKAQLLCISNFSRKYVSLLGELKREKM